MTKLSRLLPCLALGLTASSMSAQIFFGGSGNASGSVTPGTPSSAGFDSYFPLGDGSQPGSTSGTATFTADGVSAVGLASGSYTAASGWSGLSISSAASTSYPALAPNSSFGNFLNYGAEASGQVQAQLSVLDLVFSGPGGAIPVSLNVLFSGMLNASTLGDGSVSYSTSQFLVQLSGGGTTPVSGAFSGSLGLYNDGSSSNGGLLSSYAGGAVALESGVWAAPTGTPLTLAITLDGNVQTYGLYDTSGSTDAAATLALPRGTPLFNLPAGYTANSPSLSLINNLYSPVPETEHYAALAGTGLIGFAVWRRAARRA